MTYEKLIESLYKDCEEKIGLIRKEADSEIENLRTEAIDKISRFAEESKRAQSLFIKEKTDSIISAAQKKANDIKLMSENLLAERLYKIAMDLLIALRDDKYNYVLEKLIDELPQFQWQQISANPNDVETIKRYFPNADIYANPAIAGGIEAKTADGKVHIINTFGKRLEMGWADILPLIIKEIYQLGNVRR